MGVTLSAPASGSTSANISAVEVGQKGGYYAIGEVVDDLRLPGENNGQVHVSIPVCSGAAESVIADFPTFSGAGVDSSSRGVLTAGIDGQLGGSNRIYPLVSNAQHEVDIRLGQPAQVPAIDGSVSTFQVANTMWPFQTGVRQPAIREDANRWSGYDLRIHGRVPMVLDFSTARVIHDPNSIACQSDTTTDGHRVRVAAAATRQPGEPYVRHPHGPPVQGPVAPPQQQGAPSSYRCFGRCDQVCQHCGAFFWLEEKRTGLPISAQPQYQRCCAAGRVALRESIIDGLIQFLDQNNALVKLFRTARDKLRETNIPNFSIRLFGVVGANQYELPTADSIGAIVYEGGPETMTEYDVVIQRHSGEPESVNKLHPAYMALQFPLLFIYGEEGYHLKLTLTDSGGPNQEEEKRMSMKVYYAYQLKMSLTVNEGTPSATTDTSILPSRQLAYFTDLNPADNSKYIEARVYRKWTAVTVPTFTPTGFSCILLDKKGSALQANADLKEKERFERDLQINSVYRIQGFGFEKTDSWGKTLDNDFTLCFGKYTQTDLLQDNDFPYHYFNFAAFNELNTRLEKKNPILTDYIGYVHNVEKVKEYGGATGNRVKVRNVGIRNLKHNETDTRPTQLQVQTERLTNWEDEKNRNRVPLVTLLQIDPKTQKRVLFTQEAMIVEVDKGHDWYYQKCDECGGKLRYGYLHGQCHQYGSKANPENRLIITDGTANATLSCFTPQTDGLIKDINTLLLEVDDKNPATIPAAILALQRTKHTFQFQFATPTTKGPPTFILKKIMDNPPTPLLQSSVGPSSPPTVTTVTHTDEESTPPPATPVLTQDTPVEILATTTQQPKSTTKKELFGESSNKGNDPVSKKQKKE
ncbi:hypothetical protein CTI12_AA155200 [Artemisia annua]|uniref:Replication protein A 70 kDa DNA-binding subunit B/D first OB fold domain-containing protein n=1 Tax=Artemisia annua TaxID=35608 RepID=A0A2U1PGT2_ARTAN|nr:hypothetical protein CTI12_AA155200 [Artemisia annua]